MLPSGDIAGREGVAGTAYFSYFNKERMTMMNDERIGGKLLRTVCCVSLWSVILIGAQQSMVAQDSAITGKIAKYQREHSSFTTESGHTYKSAGIQNVTATSVSVITDKGIVRIKSADMPADFRKMFGLTEERVKEAEVAFARKKYDAKKAEFRKKNAEKAVSARKVRLDLKVVEEIEFGAICDAQFMEEGVESVAKQIRPGTLDRDKEVKTRYVDVKKMRPVGVPEKMLVRGLPKSLKPGSPWEGDVYMVGVFVYEEEALVPGRTGAPPLEIPMAFVDFKEAIAYRAATPADGSEGDGSGSGIAIGKNGYILTSYRLVHEATSVMVKVSDRDQPLKAQVVAKDPKENLAVLRVSSILKAASISMAPRVAIGQSVFTVGFPDVDMRSRQLKLTEGHVAALKGVQDDTRFIQVEGDFQAGNFGGGLFDEKGIVIGVITPNPPESFFLDVDGSNFEPLQYVTKGTRFQNLLNKLPVFQAETAAPADPKAAANDAAVLVTVKRRQR